MRRLLVWLLPVRYKGTESTCQPNRWWQGNMTMAVLKWLLAMMGSVVVLVVGWVVVQILT